MGTHLMSCTSCSDANLRLTSNLQIAIIFVRSKSALVMSHHRTVALAAYSGSPHVVGH